MKRAYLFLGAFVLMNISVGIASNGYAEDEIQLDMAKNRVVVMMASSSEQKEFAPVVQAVRGQMSDLSVSFQLYWVDHLPSDLPAQEEMAERVALETEAIVVFWYDLSRPDISYLYIAVPEMGRVIMHRLDGSDGGGTPEAFAIILRESVSSILRTVMDQTRDQPEKEAPPTPEAEPEEEEKQEEIKPPPIIVEQNRVAVQAAYAFDPLSSTASTIQHGFNVTVDVRIVGNWHLFAGYHVFPTISESRDGVQLQLRRHPIWIGGRYAETIGRVGLSGGIAFDIDPITGSTRVEADFENDMSLVQNDIDELQVTVVPLFCIDIRIIADIRVYLAVGAGIHLNRVDYQVEYNAEEDLHTVISLWAVYPLARAGISASFF